MNNLNIPIYRAKKIDSEEYVVGGYLSWCGTPVIFSDSCPVSEIDPTTLKISFDNGKNWKTFKEVQIALGEIK